MVTVNFKLSPFFILTFPLLFAACSPQFEHTSAERLADDPHNEPLTEPNPGETPELPVPPPPAREDEAEQILSEYDYVDPDRIIPTQALKEALLYYHGMKADLENSKVLSIIDYGQSSTKKRWYFINMETGSVWNVHVSHGKGSDSNHDGFAESFSNVSGSNATSLGFYKTAETYQGSNGYSLRLDGLSETNSRARERAIVVHGADYVQDKDVIQGRSWGCPAISKTNYKTVINLIKGGSLIFATKTNTTHPLALR